MSNNLKRNKQYACYSRTQIAQFYNKNYKTFQKMLQESGFAEKYPDFMKPCVKIYYKDKPCFEEFFGPSAWDEYLKLA